jgi:opacity protein-like surface antigen
MKLKLVCATAVALFALPSIGSAQFNYTFVDISFVDIDFDVGPVSVDGDGFAVSGAFTVGESFFIGGSYNDADFDFNIDGEITRIGGGYFHSLNEDMDFVATFGFIDAEVGVGPFSAGDDGLTLGGGIRVALADSVEVDAMLEYVDMDSGGSDTGAIVRGRYYFNEGLAVAGQVDLGKDIETFRIGVRWEF